MCRKDNGDLLDQSPLSGETDGHASPVSSHDTITAHPYPSCPQLPAAAPSSSHRSPSPRPCHCLRGVQRPAGKMHLQQEDATALACASLTGRSPSAHPCAHTHTDTHTLPTSMEQVISATRTPQQAWPASPVCADHARMNPVTGIPAPPRGLPPSPCPAILKRSLHRYTPHPLPQSIWDDTPHPTCRDE